PAMRITVLDLSAVEQRVARLQNVDDNGVRFPHRLADQLLRQPAIGAFGVKQAAACINGAVGRDAVCLSDQEVFVSMPGSRVDGAGALFERDVLGQDALRIPLEKRMPE